MAETEAVLLRRFVRTGDAEAFAEITQRYAGLVYGAALRVLADVDRAGDAAQETFLQLTKDAGAVTGSLGGWLHRVATHKAIDLMRRDASRRDREALYAARQNAEFNEWKDISPHVDEGLNALDSEIRDILVAHFLQGQTTRQIADRCGVSQATVSRRMETGVNLLRSALRKRGILVAAGTLGTLLTENAVEAAPTVLMNELGKIALLGGQTAVVSGTIGVGSGVQTVATVGAVAGVKAKVVALAAVAVLGVASVKTYQHATRPSDSNRQSTTIALPATSARPVAGVSGGAAQPAGPSEAAQEWNRIMMAARERATRLDKEPQVAAAEPPIPMEQPTVFPEEGPEPLAESPTEILGGGFIPASDPPADPNNDLNDEPIRPPGRMMGGLAGGG